MKKSYLAKFIGGLLIVNCYAGTAHAALLEFTYTSNQYGVVGSYTMNEEDILNSIAPQLEGQVSNNFIIDLNFSVNGKTWTTADIVRTDSAGYFINGPVPQVNPSSTSGSYATNGFGSITQFNPIIGVRFGDTFLTGTWSTTIAAVPVPAAVWLFGSGLGLLGWMRRRRTA